MNNRIKANGLTILSGSSNRESSIIGYGLTARLAEEGSQMIFIDMQKDGATADIAIEREYGCGASQKRLSECVTASRAGFDVIRPHSFEYPAIGEDSLEQFARDLADLSTGYDSVIISAPAGLNPYGMLSAAMCEDIILVIDPDASSVALSYCVLKNLYAEGLHNKIAVVFANINSSAEADTLKAKFDSLTEEFLNLKIKYGGFIPPYDFDYRIGTSENSNVCRPVEFVKNTRFDTLKLFQTETDREKLAGINTSLVDPDDPEVDNP